SKGRSETIQIFDATSSQTKMLDQESISNFTNGIYLTWNIQGHVTIRVTLTDGSNAVVSGVFFDGGTSTATDPVLSITKTHAGNFAQNQQGANYTVTVSNAASAAPTAGQVTVTETPRVARPPQMGQPHLRLTRRGERSNLSLRMKEKLKT
ncbi:MAG: hypothetical protein ACRD4C_07180, partial [Candidatus Acidiferrales bacterium]